MWDYKPDAGGLEPQLEELKHRFWDHLQEIWDSLENEFDKEALKQVMIFDESKPDDPCYHFVFTDKEVLKKIHFKTYMRDCWDVEQKNPSGFIHKIEVEKQKLKRFLDDQFKDIMENFDPIPIEHSRFYETIQQA